MCGDDVVLVLRIDGEAYDDDDDGGLGGRKQHDD